MIRMTFLSLITVLLGFQTFASTGSTKGNGGFVVKCTSPSGDFYQTLDIFEAHRNRSFKILEFEYESAITIALEVVDQLKTVSPHRAAIYRKHIREFMY